jgi:putative phosphoesterase
VRLGIVSDIHGQAYALRMALAAMGPIDRLLCLGDVIQQGRFCNETAGLLLAHGALTIRGNHEDAFFAGTGRAMSAVDPLLADWLASRPASLDFAAAGRRVLMVHATPWDADPIYVPPTHRDFARFAETDADVVLYGHTHTPVARAVGGVLVVNPGSVGEGRPTPRGFMRSCAVVDLARLEAEIIDLD